MLGTTEAFKASDTMAQTSPALALLICNARPGRAALSPTPTIRLVADRYRDEASADAIAVKAPQLKHVPGVLLRFNRTASFMSNHSAGC